MPVGFEGCSLARIITAGEMAKTRNKFPALGIDKQDIDLKRLVEIAARMGSGTKKGQEPMVNA